MQGAYVGTPEALEQTCDELFTGRTDWVTVRRVFRRAFPDYRESFYVAALEWVVENKYSSTPVLPALVIKGARAVEGTMANPYRKRAIRSAEDWVAVIYQKTEGDDDDAQLCVTSPAEASHILRRSEGAYARYREAMSHERELAKPDPVEWDEMNRTLFAAGCKNLYGEDIDPDRVDRDFTLKVFRWHMKTRQVSPGYTSVKQAIASSGEDQE